MMIAPKALNPAESWRDLGVTTFRFLTILIASIMAWIGMGASARASGTAGRPPALFLSAGQLVEVRRRLDQHPHAAQWSTVRKLAEADLGWSPKPFRMDDINKIRFGWCEAIAAPDDTLRELTDRLQKDSNRIRQLAVAGLLSGDVRFFEAARNAMRMCAEQSTLLNLYHLGIDFRNAAVTGATSGYCSDRPWNFALDAMWQCYGLINFADAYIILSRNSDVLGPVDDALLRNWLRELAAATNSGFHAWTRWADLHPSSSSYVRYRSDNHLSWALAGIAAAAAALDDPRIWNYVLSGGSWDDGWSGNYANPSHLRDLLDRVILSDGKIYDQDVRAGEHKGFNYACFHAWALTLLLQIAEVHRGEHLWNHAGADGGTMAAALLYYAPYVSQITPLPDSLETTDPTFFRFMYEVSTMKSWSKGTMRERLMAARDVSARNQLIGQSIGPVTLLLGDLGDAEFELGRLAISRRDDGSLLITLPPTAYGSRLLSSRDLVTWVPVSGFDPMRDTAWEIPVGEIGSGQRFFKAER
jgi:hypothetical protein